MTVTLSLACRVILSTEMTYLAQTTVATCFQIGSGWLIESFQAHHSNEYGH